MQREKKKMNRKYKKQKFTLIQYKNSYDVDIYFDGIKIENLTKFEIEEVDEFRTIEMGEFIINNPHRKLKLEVEVPSNQISIVRKFRV